MITTFKGLKRKKDQLHEVKYLIEEKTGDALIKSSVTIILEDTEILPSEPLEQIIEKGSEIAKKEYSRR